MFLDRKGLRVFIYRESIDMRCGFERLHSFCVHQMCAQMDQGHVYLFFGKNRKRLKLLVYDGSGLVLIAKRIERGSFMSHQELMGRSEVSLQDLQLLMHGSIIRRPVVDRSMAGVTPEKIRENAVTQRESVDLAKGVSQNYF